MFYGMLNTSMTGQTYNVTYRYVDQSFSAGGRQIPGWCGGPWDFSQLDWESSHKQKLGTFLVNGTPPPPKFYPHHDPNFTTTPHTLQQYLYLPPQPSNSIQTFTKKPLDSNYISSWETRRIRLVKGFTFGIYLLYYRTLFNLLIIDLGMIHLIHQLNNWYLLWSWTLNMCNYGKLRKAKVKNKIRRRWAMFVYL